jgi:hypothetical protein
LATEGDSFFLSLPPPHHPFICSWFVFLPIILFTDNRILTFCVRDCDWEYEGDRAYRWGRFEDAMGLFVRVMYLKHIGECRETYALCFLDHFAAHEAWGLFADALGYMDRAHVLAPTNTKVGT